MLGGSQIQFQMQVQRKQAVNQWGGKVTIKQQKSAVLIQRLFRRVYALEHLVPRERYRKHLRSRFSTEKIFEGWCKIQGEIEAQKWREFRANRDCPATVVMGSLVEELNFDCERTCEEFVFQSFPDAIKLGYFLNFCRDCSVFSNSVTIKSCVQLFQKHAKRFTCMEGSKSAVVGYSMERQWLCFNGFEGLLQELASMSGYIHLEHFLDEKVRMVMANIQSTGKSGATTVLGQAFLHPRLVSTLVRYENSFKPLYVYYATQEMLRLSHQRLTWDEVAKRGTNEGMSYAAFVQFLKEFSLAPGLIGFLRYSSVFIDSRQGNRGDLPCCECEYFRIRSFNDHRCRTCGIKAVRRSGTSLSALRTAFLQVTRRGDTTEVEESVEGTSDTNEHQAEKKEDDDGESTAKKEAARSKSKQRLDFARMDTNLELSGGTVATLNAGKSSGHIERILRIFYHGSQTEARRIQQTTLRLRERMGHCKQVRFSMLDAFLHDIEQENKILDDYRMVLPEFVTALVLSSRAILGPEARKELACVYEAEDADELCSADGKFENMLMLLSQHYRDLFGVDFIQLKKSPKNVVPTDEGLAQVRKELNKILNLAFYRYARVDDPLRFERISLETLALFVHESGCFKGIERQQIHRAAKVVTSAEYNGNNKEEEKEEPRQEEEENEEESEIMLIQRQQTALMSRINLDISGEDEEDQDAAIPRKVKRKTIMNSSTEDTAQEQSRKIEAELCGVNKVQFKNLVDILLFEQACVDQGADPTKDSAWYRDISHSSRLISPEGRIKRKTLERLKLIYLVYQPAAHDMVNLSSIHSSTSKPFTSVFKPKQILSNQLHQELISLQQHRRRGQRSVGKNRYNKLLSNAPSDSSGPAPHIGSFAMAGSSKRLLSTVDQPSERRRGSVVVNLEKLRQEENPEILMENRKLKQATNKIVAMNQNKTVWGALLQVVKTERSTNALPTDRPEIKLEDEIHNEEQKQAEHLRHARRKSSALAKLERVINWESVLNNNYGDFLIDNGKAPVPTTALGDKDNNKTIGAATTQKTKVKLIARRPTERTSANAADRRKRFMPCIASPRAKQFLRQQTKALNNPTEGMLHAGDFVATELLLKKQGNLDSDSDSTATNEDEIGDNNLVGQDSDSDGDNEGKQQMERDENGRLVVKPFDSGAAIMKVSCRIEESLGAKRHLERFGEGRQHWVMFDPTIGTEESIDNVAEAEESLDSDHHSHSPFLRSRMGTFMTTSGVSTMTGFDGGEDPYALGQSMINIWKGDGLSTLKGTALLDRSIEPMKKDAPSCTKSKLRNEVDLTNRKVGDVRKERRAMMRQFKVLLGALEEEHKKYGYTKKVVSENETPVNNDLDKLQKDASQAVREWLKKGEEEERKKERQRKLEERNNKAKGITSLFRLVDILRLEANLLKEKQAKEALFGQANKKSVDDDSDSSDDEAEIEGEKYEEEDDDGTEHGEQKNGESIPESEGEQVTTIVATKEDRQKTTGTAVTRYRFKALPSKPVTTKSRWSTQIPNIKRRESFIKKHKTKKRINRPVLCARQESHDDPASLSTQFIQLLAAGNSQKDVVKLEKALANARKLDDDRLKISAMSALVSATLAHVEHNHDARKRKKILKRVMNLLLEELKLCKGLQSSDMKESGAYEVVECAVLGQLARVHMLREDFAAAEFVNRDRFALATEYSLKIALKERKETAEKELEEKLLLLLDGKNENQKKTLGDSDFIMPKDAKNKKKRKTDREWIIRHSTANAGVGAALAGIGNALLKQGKYEEALEMFQEHARLARSTNNRKDLAVALSNQGYVFCQLQFWDEAQRVYLEEMALYLEAEDGLWQKHLLGIFKKLAHVTMQLEDLEETQAILMRWADHARLMNDRESEAQAMLFLVEVLLEQEQQCGVVDEEGSDVDVESLLLDYSGSNVENRFKQLLSMKDALSRRMQQKLLATEYYKSYLEISGKKNSFHNGKLRELYKALNLC